ncbi:MAG: site-specific integrase [Geobacteraceae bacterium]|jgi:integrase
MYYLLKRGSVYYARLWVPLDMQGRLKRRELKKSLKTCDRSEAKAVAMLLSAKAEKFYMRVRAKIMTDRELKVLEAELIEEFTGRVARHKQDRLDALDWIFTDDGSFPAVDLGMIQTTLKSPRTPADVASVVAWYTQKIGELEQEIATEFYSWQTRHYARQLAGKKSLAVILPPDDWFTDPGQKLRGKYDAEFDETIPGEALPYDEAIWNSPSPADFNHICILVLQAQIEAFRHELEKIQGKLNTPLQQQIAARIEAIMPRPILSDIWEEHSRECLTLRKWKPGTARKNKDNYEKAVRILGNKELSGYSDQDAVHLIEALEKKEMSISSQKYCVELLSTLWRRALKHPKKWHVEFNPFLEKSPKDRRPEHEQQDALTKEDLERMFVCLSKIRRRVESEKFWGPLISLYSGMRLNEVSQLRVEDIEDAEGVLIFNIRNRAEYDQTTKDDADKVCPVHPTLIAIGFREYLKDRKTVKADRLFKNVFLYEGKWKKKIGDWFNRTLRPKFAPDGNKSFHSLRHTFLNYCKQNGLYKTRDDELVLQSMVGHEADYFTPGNSITLRRYGKAYAAKRQLKLLKKIDYRIDLKLLEKDYNPEMAMV